MKFGKKALAVLMAAAICAGSASAAFAVDTPPSGGTPGGSAPGGEAPSGSPPSGGGGANTMTYDYSGTLSGALTADGTAVSSSGESTSAATADQNAALVENGGTLTIENGTLTKSGDDTNGDNCNFYGINSILLAVGDGSTAYVAGSSLSASSEGSNGIFATDNASVYVSDTSISTTAGNSRGLDATYGGSIIADSLNITTQGDHCASLATDRGGGSISVTNSALSTAGSGSPLLYSTGDIEVSSVTGTASGSQIAGMEGLNTILILNSDLTSTLTKATASDPIADGIIIYQSTSGDAESTTGAAATFQAVNSKLTSAIESGAMFYVTNTTANIVLSGTTLNFDSSKAALLTVAGNDANSWGTAGSNGATVNFTGRGETLNGDISADTISTLALYFLDGTAYTGKISVEQNAVNTKVSDAPVTVNFDASSKWIVTGDSTVTNLNAEQGAKIVDAGGKTVSIVVNGEKVVTGESSLTVTVTGSYSTAVTTGSVNEISTDYIDRTAFDSYYGTATAFSAGTTQSTAAATTAAATTAATTATAAATTAAATTASSAQTTAAAQSASSSGSALPWILVIAAAAAAAVLLLRKKHS